MLQNHVCRFVGLGIELSSKTKIKKQKNKDENILLSNLFSFFFAFLNYYCYYFLNNF